MMKRILITGALGHIGSKFIHNIRPDRYEKVIILDNLSTQRYCSLFNLPENVQFRFYEDDVCTADLEKYLKDVDVVIHLAAITNAAGSFEIQEQVEKVNFEGTQRVALACVKAGCKIIFLSTTSVYGTQELIVDENCPKEDLKPQSPYASSKLHAEQYLHELGEIEGLEYIICRFGTIYGTSIGMRFHTAINKFCWQATNGLPITVWRTAINQKRPYLYLDDAIRAVNFIIENDQFDNNIYNVLTDNATVGEIIEIIKTYISNINIEYVDSRIMNQLSYTVANTKFMNLGFKYTGKLSDGIGNTLDLIRGIRMMPTDR